MRRIRWVRLPMVVLAATILVLTSCATTSLGKAVQTADGEKQLVTIAAREAVKMHECGKPANSTLVACEGVAPMNDATYDKAKDLYNKWAVGQKGLADTLVQWKRSASQENADKLGATLNALAPLTQDYLTFIKQFVDVDRLKARLGI